MTRGGGRPRGGVPWGSGEVSKEASQTVSGMGQCSVCGVPWSKARPEVPPGQGGGGGRCWEERLVYSQEGQKV